MRAEFQAKPWSIEAEFIGFVEDPTDELYDANFSVSMPLGEAHVRDVIGHGIRHSVTVRVNGRRPLRADEEAREYAKILGVSAGDMVPRVEVVIGRKRVLWAKEANVRLEAVKYNDPGVLVPVKVEFFAAASEEVGATVAQLNLLAKPRT